MRIEELAVRSAPVGEGPPAGDAPPITADDRDALVEADRAASWAARREHARLRSFRTVVALTTLSLFLLAVGIAIVSAVRPAWIPLCFAPQGTGAVVCPTSAAPTGGAETAPSSVDERAP